MDTGTVITIVDKYKEVGEWSRKIIEVYMGWYTFFGSSNVLALGWIFGTKIDNSVKPMLRPISFLFCTLNALGTMSTLFVGFAVSRNAGEYSSLIKFAALANSVALLGFAFVWVRCWKLVSHDHATHLQKGS